MGEGAAQTVAVRWLDGYLEVFSDLDEVRFSPGLLFLAKGPTNRHIPLAAVRWFSLATESHWPPVPHCPAETED